MGSFIGGIIIALVGFLLVWKAEWFFDNFGTIPFAEKYLHLYGGGRLFYKLLGLVIIFFGFMVMTGMIGGFILGTVGTLFTGAR